MQMQDLLFQAMSIRDVMGSNSLEPRAWQLYERCLRPARKGLLGLFSKHKPLVTMPDLDGSRHWSGLVAVKQTIAVGDILGSLYPRDDLDVDFRPIKSHNPQRWVKVATAMLRNMELPPVELVMLNERYYVRDGHLRVSVARVLDIHYVDALVWGMPIEFTAVRDEQNHFNCTGQSLEPELVVSFVIK
jgi:hypothetical protein